MGIKKDVKPKEEYVFDQVDFDKYVEYCKTSNLYNLKPPIKEIYVNEQFFFKSFSIIKMMCLFNEIWFTCGFILFVWSGVSPIISFIPFFLPFCLALITHILSIRRLREERDYENNKNEEFESAYNIEYNIWIQKLKKQYIPKKKKEFIEFQKQKKILERYDKLNKKIKIVEEIIVPVIKYWIPSWIYFIMRILDGEVRYVGQSMDVDRRKKNHARGNYPKKEFVLKPIERVDLTEIDSKEKFWIDRFGIENLDNKQNGGSNITKRKGFKKPEPIIYVPPTLEELEIVEKWLRITENKNNK